MAGSRRAPSTIAEGTGSGFPERARLELPAKPEPLVPRRLWLEVTKRSGAGGIVLTPLALDELGAISDVFQGERVESVAVCLLHAYANPAHERALRLGLAPRFRHLTISSDVNAEFREYERSCTAVLKAAVMSLAASYLDGLGGSLHRLNARMRVHLLYFGVRGVRSGVRRRGP